MFLDVLEAFWLHSSHVVQGPPLLGPCMCEEKNLKEIWILSHLAFDLKQNSVCYQELYTELEAVFGDLECEWPGICGKWKNFSLLI